MERLMQDYSLKHLSMEPISRKVKIQDSTQNIPKAMLTANRSAMQLNHFNDNVKLFKVQKQNPNIIGFQNWIINSAKNKLYYKVKI